MKKGSKSTSAQIPVRRALSPSPSATVITGTTVPLRTRVVQLLAWSSEGTDEKALNPLRAEKEELQSILSSVSLEMKKWRKVGVHKVLRDSQIYWITNSHYFCSLFICYCERARENRVEKLLTDSYSHIQFLPLRWLPIPGVNIT